MRAVSVDSALLPHIGDAITQLTHSWHWELVDDEVSEIVAACKDAVESWYSGMLVGSVCLWMVSPPAGWLLLDGSVYASADYPELAALLPAHLIGGANFTLPDVTDSFSFGVVDEDDGAQVTGSNVLVLSVAQLPAHTHTYTPPTLTIPVGPPPTIPVGGIGSPVPSGSTGSGDDIDTRPSRFGLIYAVYAGRE